MNNIFLIKCILLKLNYIKFVFMLKILSVCLGNICRSPLAHGILEDYIVKSGYADRFFLLIINSLPFLRTILQSALRFFMAALTFMLFYL